MLSYNITSSAGQGALKKANLSAALAHAAADRKVIPFHLVPHKTPGKDPIKKPCITDWQARATTDPATIRRWWDKWPDAMPGLPTGRGNGFVVIDVDLKNGKDGFAALRAMSLDPETLSPVIGESPTGGQHLFFRWQEGMGNSNTGLPEGLDVRGEGGYVAAPGAVNGRGAYRLLQGSLDDPLPDLPDALHPARRRPSGDTPASPTGLPFHVITSALAALPNDGNAYASRDAWLQVGMALHAECDGGEDGREVWHEWSRQWPGYDDAATEAAWDSFRAGRGVTGWTIIAQAEGQGWHDPAVADLRRTVADEEAQADFDSLLSVEDLRKLKLDARIRELVGEPEDAPAAPKPSGLTFETPGPFVLSAARPYVLKRLLVAGDVGAIVGAPGVGKSLIGPRLAYAVAKGESVFGLKARQGGVFYVAAEDHHGMRARKDALWLEHGDAPNFALVGGVTSLFPGSDDLKALRVAVKERRPALVVIDTLAMAFPGLKENEADAMGQVVAAARALTKWGAAVVLIHHDTKDGGNGLPRGHSLLNGALDVSLHLTRDGQNGIVRGKLTKNRNGPADLDIAFTIGATTLGQDEDGDDITAAFARDLEPGEAGQRVERLPRSAAAALAVFSDLSGAGEPITESDWRKACLADSQVSAADTSRGRRLAFQRALQELLRRERVREADGMFWPAFAQGVPHEDFDDVPV